MSLLRDRELDQFPTPEARKHAVKLLGRRLGLWRQWGLFFVAIQVSILTTRWLVRSLPFTGWLRLLLEYAMAGVFGLALGASISILFKKRRQQILRRLLREEGVPVCLHCGYNLRGQTEPRCPECGQAFDLRLLKPNDPPAAGATDGRDDAAGTA